MQENNENKPPQDEVAAALAQFDKETVVNKAESEKAAKVAKRERNSEDEKTIKVVATEPCFFKSYRKRGDSFTLKESEAMVEVKNKDGTKSLGLHPALQPVKKGEKAVLPVEKLEGSPYGNPPALRK